MKKVCLFFVLLISASVFSQKKFDTVKSEKLGQTEE